MSLRALLERSLTYFLFFSSPPTTTLHTQLPFDTRCNRLTIMFHSLPPQYPDKSCENWFSDFSFTYERNSHFTRHILYSCYNATVCRKPNRLCSYKVSRQFPRSERNYFPTEKRGKLPPKTPSSCRKMAARPGVKAKRSPRELFSSTVHVCGRSFPRLFFIFFAHSTGWVKRPRRIFFAIINLLNFLWGF